MNMLSNRVPKSRVLDWTRFLSLYFSLPFNTCNFTTDRWIVILSSGLGYESYNLCKMITINNQALSWLLSRLKGSYFSHNLSFVCLKLFILCKRIHQWMSIQHQRHYNVTRDVFLLYLCLSWNQQTNEEACSYLQQVCWRCQEVYFDLQQRAGGRGKTIREVENKAC